MSCAIGSWERDDIVLGVTPEKSRSALQRDTVEGLPEQRRILYLVEKKTAKACSPQVWEDWKEICMVELVINSKE